MANGTTLTSYNPTLRDRIAWWLSDNLAGGDRGMTNYINDKVRGGVDFLPVVGDAVGFDDAAREFNAGNYGKAAFDAGTSAIGSVPGVGDAVAGLLKSGGGALATFFGPASKKWDPAMHSKAMDMADEGRSMEEINAETGLSFGKDRRWRGEMSDAGSKFNLPKFTGIGSYFRGFGADEILDHPELYEHYPELAGVNISRQASHRGNEGLLGFFDPGSGPEKPPELVLFPGNIKDSPNLQHLPPEEANKSVALHEIQHYIQSKEGFDPGSSVPHIRSQMHQSGFTQGLYDKMFDAYLNSRGMDLNDPRIYDQMAKDFPGVDPFNEEEYLPFLNNALYETYMRNSGETEARNVQTRMGLSLNDRRMIHPNATADRSIGEQLTEREILGKSFSPEHLRDIDPMTLRGEISGDLGSLIDQIMGRM